MTRELLDLDGIKHNLSMWIALTKQGKYSIRELQLLIDSYYLGIQEARSIHELTPLLQIFANARHCASQLSDKPLKPTELFKQNSSNQEPEMLKLAEDVQNELDTVRVFRPSSVE